MLNAIKPSYVNRKATARLNGKESNTIKIINIRVTMTVAMEGKVRD